MTISNEKKLGYNELNQLIANATAEILSKGDVESPEDLIDALAEANLFDVNIIDQGLYIEGYVDNVIDLMRNNESVSEYPFTPDGYDEIMRDLYGVHKENGLDIEAMNRRLGLEELIRNCGLATKQRIKEINVT